MRFPSWVHTIRFRLAATYTLLLLAGMSVVVACVYAGFASTVDSAPVAAEAKKTGYVIKSNGKLVPITDTGQLTEFEEAVNSQTLSTLRSYSLVSLAALPFLSAGLGWWLSGRALRPVQRIASVAREIEANDLSRRIALQGPKDELHDLADTFDRMLQRLDDAFVARQRFVDEASHDLRNPLAVMRTNLDVVLRDPEATVDDHRRAAEIAVRAADRMGTLVEELVGLARRQNTTDHRADVDLDALVRDVSEEHRAGGARRGLEIVTSGAGGRVPGDPVELRRTLGNLLENAVRLAPTPSRVTVLAGGVPGWAWLAVRDEGPGVPPGDRENVFDRTWTGDPGRRGLGLAIAAQVARGHGGDVRMFAAGGGSVFVVWLPRSARPDGGVPVVDPTLP